MTEEDAGYLASYLEQRQHQFVDNVEGTIDPTFTVNYVELKDLIVQFFEELP